MKLETTYEEVCKHFPDDVAQVLERQKLSTSMHKDAPPEELKWSYEWCVSFTESMSLWERMTTPPEEPGPDPTLEEMLADFETSMSADRGTNGAVFMSVHARKGRGNWGSGNRLTTMPPAVRAHLERVYNEDKAEKERLAALTPEQREAEIEALLGQLRGPGFIEIRDGEVTR